MAASQVTLMHKVLQLVSVPLTIHLYHCFCPAVHTAYCIMVFSQIWLPTHVMFVFHAALGKLLSEMVRRRKPGHRQCVQARQ